MTTIMYVSAILAVVIILTIIGVLSRYRRCKPNQVLVVYGKTGGEKKSAKLYHGGAAFVLPIIQSYDVLSMEPMQIDCKLTGALSSQNIRVYDYYSSYQYKSRNHAKCGRKTFGDEYRIY